jgi:hypothetical protein
MVTNCSTARPLEVVQVADLVLREAFHRFRNCSWLTLIALRRKQVKDV